MPTNKKGLEAFQRAMTQKSFKYSHQSGVKIDKLTLKTWKGEGNNEKKKKTFGRNIERRYQKPPRCPLISRTCLHVELLHVEFYAKKKGEGNKAKEDIEDPNATIFQ